MIERVWECIVRNQGKEFQQIRGKIFTYKIKGKSISLDTTNYTIPKSHIEKALSRYPFENTTVIQDLIAPSYIYAIMMDEKVRKIITEKTRSVE